MNNYLAYASYFASYLLNNLNDLAKINRIILFGSAARNEAKKDSDVDIFLDVKKINKDFEKKINNILNSFYKSREALIFKNLRIDNKIALIVDKLENFPELKLSMESDGIVLYENYVSTDLGGKKQLIISWDKIAKNRGAFLNKLYGFKVKDKRYKGLIEELGGSKLGKSSIIVPIQNKSEIFNLLKKYGVRARIVEVYA